MTVSITFQFDNIHQLTDFCMRCTPNSTAAAIREEPVPSVTVNAEPIPIPAEDGGLVAEPVVTKAKPGRPKGSKAVAPAAETLAPIGADSAPKEPLTIAHADAAMKKLYNAKGTDACLTLLKDFKTTRVSGVNPADYEKFIAQCDKAVAA
jgi:hypothetical protein